MVSKMEKCSGGDLERLPNAGEQLLLTVQSAYSLNSGKSSLAIGKIKFVKAVELVMNGERPKPSKR